MDSYALEPLPGAIAALIIGVPLTIIFFKKYRRGRKEDRAEQESTPDKTAGARFISRISHAGELAALAVPVGFTLVGVFLLGVSISRMI